MFSFRGSACSAPSRGTTGTGTIMCRVCGSSGGTDSLTLRCTFCGCVAETFTALTHPGMSVRRLGLYCWQTSRRVTQFDFKYMNKMAQVYCTVSQSCITAQGLISGSFSGTDRLLVGNKDRSIQK